MLEKLFEKNEKCLKRIWKLRKMFGNDLELMKNDKKCINWLTMRWWQWWWWWWKWQTYISTRSRFSCLITQRVDLIWRNFFCESTPQCSVIILQIFPYFKIFPWNQTSNFSKTSIRKLRYANARWLISKYWWKHKMK